MRVLYGGNPLIRCDIRIGLTAAAQHPNCLEVIVSISGAAGRIAVGVKPIGDREGKGGSDRLGLAAGQPEVTRLFDNHRLGDQGLKSVTPAVCPPDGDIVIGAVRMGAGGSDHNAVVVRKDALLSHAPDAGCAVGELDGHAVRGDCVSDGSKGSQVFQQTAGYVGIGVGTVQGNGLVVPETGDLQVLN